MKRSGGTAERRGAAEPRRLGVRSVLGPVGPDILKVDYFGAVQGSKPEVKDMEAACLRALQEGVADGEAFRHGKL